jgi:predicted phage tail protein
MKTILLYGHLGRRFGRVHRYDVSSAAEAVRAMCVTISGFKKALIDGGSYRVLVGGHDALGKENLREPLPSRSTLRIVPVVSGAANGVGQTILGIILVVVGYFTGGSTVNTGIALIIGGVAQYIFAPRPNTDSLDSVDNRPSYAFDGAVNTAAQGNPLSVCYGGPLIVGSQVASAELSVEQT